MADTDGSAELRDDAPGRTELHRSMTAGAAWMIALRLCVTGIGSVSTLILARLLLPSDFGLVSLATAVVAGLELLTNFRFDVPLIQNQSATRDDYDTAWTLNLMMGGILGLLAWIAALPAARFFGEPRLLGVLLVLGFTSCLDGARNIGIVNFQKEFVFAREFALTASRKLAGFVVALTIAWVFRSYWALAAGITASSCWGLIASYAMHPYRPRLSTRTAPALLHFSKWLVLDNVIQFLRFRSGDFLIGKLAGTGSLGLFNLANDIASLTHDTITAPINRALLPGYARVSSDSRLLHEMFLAVLGITTLTAMPAAVGTAALAPLIVPLLLGDHWLATIPLIQILGLATAITLTGTGTAIAYLALGRPVLVVAFGLSYVVVFLSAMALLLPRFGLAGAAWSVLIASLTNIPIQLALVSGVLGPVLRAWVAAVWRPVLGAALMYYVVSAYASRAGTGAGSLIANTLAAMGLGAASYVGVVLAAWYASGQPEGAERRALRLLSQVVLGRSTVQPSGTASH